VRLSVHGLSHTQANAPIGAVGGIGTIGGIGQGAGFVDPASPIRASATA